MSSNSSGTLIDSVERSDRVVGNIRLVLYVDLVFIASAAGITVQEVGLGPIDVLSAALNYNRLRKAFILPPAL